MKSDFMWLKQLILVPFFNGLLFIKQTNSIKGKFIRGAQGLVTVHFCKKISKDFAFQIHYIIYQRPNLNKSSSNVSSLYSIDSIQWTLFNHIQEFSNLTPRENSFLSRKYFFINFIFKKFNEICMEEILFKWS